MAETYPYPVEGCDHAPFKTFQALQSYIRSSHPGGWGRKAQPRKSPSLRSTSPLLNWLGVSIWTLEKAASYGSCDKLALRWLSGYRT